jgi:hypothetical protein
MIGQVWSYNKETQAGRIIGRDKQQYSFSKKDYQGRNALKEGNMVDFTIEGACATDVTLMTAAPRH